MYQIYRTNQPLFVTYYVAMKIGWLLSCHVEICSTFSVTRRTVLVTLITAVRLLEATTARSPLIPVGDLLERFALGGREICSERIS